MLQETSLGVIKQSDVLPFKSYVPEIKSREHLFSFIKEYVKEDTFGTVKITPESFLNEPKLIDEVTIVTLYSFKILLGSIENYPAASQLQFILRINNQQDDDGQYKTTSNSNNINSSSIFMELVINIDEEVKEQEKHRFINGEWKIMPLKKMLGKGYKIYTINPLTFLNIIQTPTSNIEKKALSDMMKTDGILISSLISPGLTWEIPIKFPVLQYFKVDHFFGYKFIRNISWSITYNPKIYKKWLKCVNWNTQINYQMIKCQDSQTKVFHSENFISLIPEVINPYDLELFQDFCYLKENRVFDDGEYDYTNLFYGINRDYIDRVYHMRCLKGTSRLTGRIMFLQYELMARMVINSKGLQKQEYIYLEMIININENICTLSDSILFITKNPRLFMYVIQTGNKNYICKFIVSDESLPFRENNLQSQCIQTWVNYIIKKKNINTKAEWEIIANEKVKNDLNIPYNLKSWLMEIVQYSLITKHWKRGVGDMIQDSTNPDIIWEDNFKIEEFKFYWYMRYLIKCTRQDRSSLLASLL